MSEAEELLIYKRAFRWFANWPEFVTSPDFFEFAVRDIRAAGELYQADPIPPLEERAIVEARRVVIEGGKADAA